MAHLLPPGIPDPGNYIRERCRIPRYEMVDLYALPSPPPGIKPPYGYVELVLLAIHGSPRRMLTLQEIYTAIETRFEWYYHIRHDKTWKDSIRHKLSLSLLFRCMPKPDSEPGNGHYWYIDISDGDGNKRERRRGGNTTSSSHG